MHYSMYKMNGCVTNITAQETPIPANRTKGCVSVSMYVLYAIARVHQIFTETTAKLVEIPRKNT